MLSKNGKILQCILVCVFPKCRQVVLQVRKRSFLCMYNKVLFIFWYLMVENRYNYVS